MFSKYTGVDVPQNYSGNRFRKSTMETKTNVHKAQEIRTPISTVKTSVSPSFQDVIDKASEGVIVNDVEENLTTQEVDLEEKVLKSVDKTEILEDDEAKSPREPLDIIQASGIGQLLGAIGKDDLLLIALIVLLASDKGDMNLDAIVILALLLYH